MSRQNVRVFCKYCGKFLYDTISCSDTYSTCKYSRPDCNIENRNFMRSLHNAENSKSRMIKKICKYIRKKLADGEYPLNLKPLLKLAIKAQVPEKMIVVKSK